MPSINLRLTEQEHDALRAWAFEGKRSLQREIIFRLFSEPTAVGREHHLPQLAERDATTPPKVPSGGDKANNPQDGDLTGMRDGTPMTGRSRSASCGMNVPAGTKCKVCGKVHPV